MATDVQATLHAAHMLAHSQVPTTDKVSYAQFVKEIPQQSYGKEELGARAFKSLSMLHRSHPTAVKVGTVALLALGIVGIMAGAHVGLLGQATPFLNAHVGQFAWSPTLKAVGGALTGVAVLTGINIGLSYLPYGGLGINHLQEAPPHIEDSERMFEERVVEIDGVKANIRYITNEEGGRAIPVCTIEDASDPQKAGKAYGYIIAKQVSGILPLVRCVGGAVGIPDAKKHPQNVAELLRVLRDSDPDMYAKLEGMVEGYNQWAADNGKTGDLTLEELYLMHFPPERCGWSMPDEPASEATGDRPPLGANGCISITAQTNDGPVHASNTDWETLGIFGRYGLLVVEKNVDGNGKHIAEFRIAGHAGGVWGVNSDGVFVRMNVAVQPNDMGNSALDGVAAFCYNSWILRNAEDADVYASGIHPLSGYSLTVVDQKTAKLFHMHGGIPGLATANKKRTLEKEPLMVAANPTYNSSGDVIVNVCHGDKREQRVCDMGNDFLRRVVDGAQYYADLVRRMIALPQVNNGQTMCSTYYHAGEQRIGVAIDNSYAASNALVFIKLSDLWGTEEPQSS